MSSPTPKRVFVFDSPRCCSHLFRKLFSAHPRLTHIDMPYFATWMGTESVTTKIDHSPEALEALAERTTNAPLTATLDNSFAGATAKLMQAIADAEGGKAVDSAVSGLPEFTHDTNGQGAGNVVMIQDHAPLIMQSDVVLSVLRDLQSPYRIPSSPKITSNPTHVPEDLLLTITPIFLIRNPMLSVPSMYRVQKPWTKNTPSDEEFRILSSQIFARVMYDWFKAKGHDPLVVDAGDLIADPEGQTALVCATLGVDPSGVQTTWAALPVEQQPPDKMMRHFLEQIWASTGINQSTKKDLSLETEMSKWTSEFGAATAEQLRRRVEEEMIGYNYMRKAVVKV